MTILQNFQTTRYELSNGLRVLVREDHSAPVVAIFTHVLAGYFDEPDEWVGISHVLEHMFFKGTPTRGPGEIAQETKSAGGYLNASTIYDHTSYYTVLPSSMLEQGVDIQTDALINSVVDEEQLRKELQVIIQEAKRKRDNPGAVARESLFELMFDKHRMRRWRIGEEAQLAQYRRADVVGFMEKFYTTDAIILVVAGDVNSEEVLALLEAKCRDLRKGSPVRDRGPAETTAPGFRAREITGDVVHTRIELGWHTPATMHPDTPLLDLLAIVLGQGRASHLYRNVRDTGLASAVGAHNYTPTDLGVFGITAEAEPADAAHCLSALRRTLESVRADAITDADVARAQSILEARLLRGIETMEGQASFVAEWEALGDWENGVRYMEQVRAAKRADLSRVAHEYLSLDTASVLAYRPRSAPSIEDAMQKLHTNGA